MSSARARLRSAFLKNPNKVLTTSELSNIAGIHRWHQRLSELRIEEGMKIESWKDKDKLQVGQYVFSGYAPTRKTRKTTTRKNKTYNKKRSGPSRNLKLKIQKRSQNRCEFIHKNKQRCKLRAGATDSVTNSTVHKLQYDHKKAFSHSNLNKLSSPSDWLHLCPRHNLTKKNFYSGPRPTQNNFNVLEIVRSSNKKTKKKVHEYLVEYFDH
jgi:hypothetical protein